MEGTLGSGSLVCCHLASSSMLLNQGYFCLPRDTWKHFWLSQEGQGARQRLPIASSEQRPEMLVNVLQCTWQPLTTKNYLASKANSTGEKILCWLNTSRTSCSLLRELHCTGHETALQSFSLCWAESCLPSVLTHLLQVCSLEHQSNVSFLCAAWQPLKYLKTTSETMLAQAHPFSHL